VHLWNSARFYLATAGRTFLFRAVAFLVDCASIPAEEESGSKPVQARFESEGAHNVTGGYESLTICADPV